MQQHFYYVLAREIPDRAHLTDSNAVGIHPDTYQDVQTLCERPAIGPAFAVGMQVCRFCLIEAYIRHIDLLRKEITEGKH